VIHHVALNTIATEWSIWRQLGGRGVEAARSGPCTVLGAQPLIKRADGAMQR
jgi:hypothetical protein